MPRTSRRLPVVREVSAGGLVVDDTRAPTAGVLIAHRVRAGIAWTLPKGHLEPGETGLTARVIAPLGTVDYWFVADARRIHKWVHHYVLAGAEGRLHTADIEVEDVAWVPLDELADRLRYPDEKALVARLPEALGLTEP
jgi:8-oxo-dGTP pyrophosphatase MutT (NUDIX family)